MTLEEFIKKYIGKSVGYPEGEFVGECLSSVKWYIKEVFGINPPPSGSNSAYGYWSNFPIPLGEIFEKINNTPNNVPQRGDIIVWKPWSTNQYGHIAIFESGNLDSFKSWDQNWDGKELHLQPHDYKNVTGWLRPINNSEPTMTEEEKRILQFLEEQKANEGKVREAFGALKDLPIKDAEIQTLQARILTLENSLSSMEDRLTALESELKANLDLVENQQSEVLAAKKELSKKNEELEAMTQQKNQYKNWYEKALNKAAEKLSIKELLSIIINRLFKR